MARQTQARFAEGLALGWLAYVRYLCRLQLAQIAEDWEADGRANYNQAVIEAACQNWELARAHASDALKVFDHHGATEACSRVQKIVLTIHGQASADKVKSEAAPV